jgi:DNA-binding beta-propeller fold protein YncE
VTTPFARVVLPASFLGATFLPCLAGGVSAQSTTSRRVLPLQLEEQIPVPGVSGRLDHFTVDAKRRRVIFSALGNNTVEVIDTFAGKVIRTIRDLSAPQGVLYVPEFDQLYVANAVDGKVSVFGGAEYEFRRNIDFGEDPDNLRYDPVSKKVFVGYGRDSGGIGRIDPATAERVGKDLKTGGHPESFQLDARGARLFVNVPDAGNVVEAFDLNSGAMEKWTLGSLRQNYAMAVDSESSRLFTVTRKNPMLVVLDTRTGKEITRLRVAGECDDVFLDRSRKRIYVIGAEGFVSVVQQASPDRYSVLSEVPSTIGAKTGFFYEQRDRMYVGVPAKGNEPAQVWTYEAED